MHKVVGLVAALLVALAACAPAAGGPPVLRNLCTARDAGSFGRAADAFGRAHADLHELARTVADRDRRAAGRLLEAKQRVESALARNASDVLATELPELVTAVRSALQTVGSPAPSCPDSS